MIAVAIALSFIGGFFANSVFFGAKTSSNTFAVGDSYPFGECLGTCPEHGFIFGMDIVTVTVTHQGQVVFLANYPNIITAAGEDVISRQAACGAYLPTSSTTTASSTTVASSTTATSTSAYTVSVSPSSGSYSGSQTIQLTGTVSPAPGSGTSATIDVLNPSGTLVRTDDVSVNGTTGAFSDSFVAGGTNWINGEYTVVVTWELTISGPTYTGTASFAYVTTVTTTTSVSTVRPTVTCANGGVYIALSTDTTTPAATDTTCPGEITSNGLARTLGTYTHTTGANTYEITASFIYSTSASSTTITKVCMFDAASGGDLFAESLLTPSATVSAVGDNVTIQWTFTH